jgi:hypothetical protein
MTKNPADFSNPEVQEGFLDIMTNSKFITIATINADGSPRSTPLSWFALDQRGGAVVFDCRARTMHGANLARDGRCFITVVNYDKGYERSIYIQSFARKLTGQAYEKAKELILSAGKNVTDDIFAAPFGEIDKKKSQIGFNDKGRPRFYLYMKSENVK